MRESFICYLLFFFGLFYAPASISCQTITLSYDANGNRTTKKYNAPTPDTPVISKFSNQLISTASSGNQWFRNDTALTGATSQLYNYEVKGKYSVKVSNGCTSVPSNVIYIGIYIFTGNGDWNVAANWEGQQVPLLPLSNGEEIIIDPSVGGSSIRNGDLRLLKGSSLTIKPGKKLQINGNTIVE